MNKQGTTKEDTGTPVKGVFLLGRYKHREYLKREARYIRAKREYERAFIDWDKYINSVMVGKRVHDKTVPTSET